MNDVTMKRVPIALWSTFMNHPQNPGGFAQVFFRRSRDGKGVCAVGNAGGIIVIAIQVFLSEGSANKREAPANRQAPLGSEPFGSPA